MTKLREISNLTTFSRCRFSVVMMALTRTSSIRAIAKLVILATGSLSLVPVCLVACCQPVEAAKLALPDAPFRYTVIDQDVADAIRQFCDDVHVRVSVSDGVKGQVRGQLSATTPRQFLDLITSEYGLDWYYDGYTLYVTPTSEGVSKVIALSGGSVASLTTALASAGILDRRFPLHALPGSKQVLVSGPPRYVDLVDQTASSLASPKSAPTPALTDDLTIVYRGSGTQRLDFPQK